MSNKVAWDSKNIEFNPNNTQTCFQKYAGEDVIKVERRELILSKITKKIKN